MKRLVLLLGLWLLCGVNMHAQPEPRVGMGKDEVIRVFDQYIVERSPKGDLTLRMPFYDHPANVFVGFDGGKVFFVSVSFTSFLDGSDRTNRLSLFREVRKRLEGLGGRGYAYARIDGVDVLGDSGGGVTDKRKMNAFVFGTVRDGLVYQVEIFATTIDGMAQAGEVSLTIDKEESVKPPTSK